MQAGKAPIRATTTELGLRASSQARALLDTAAAIDERTRGSGGAAASSPLNSTGSMPGEGPGSVAAANCNGSSANCNTSGAESSTGDADCNTSGAVVEGGTATFANTAPMPASPEAQANCVDGGPTSSPHGHGSPATPHMHCSTSSFNLFDDLRFKVPYALFCCLLFFCCCVVIPAWGCELQRRAVADAQCLAAARARVSVTAHAVELARVVHIVS